MVTDDLGQPLHDLLVLETERLQYGGNAFHAHDLMGSRLGPDLSLVPEQLITESCTPPRVAEGETGQLPDVMQARAQRRQRTGMVHVPR
nr:hypothetical protein [Streptomyces reniochalinae]